MPVSYWLAEAPLQSTALASSVYASERASGLPSGSCSLAEPNASTSSGSFFLSGSGSAFDAPKRVVGEISRLHSKPPLGRLPTRGTVLKTIGIGAAIGKRKSGVNSGASWFCDSVQFPALRCSSLARNPLILFDRARHCILVRLRSTD